MADGSCGNWRALFVWKTAGPKGANYTGDYRIKVSINLGDTASSTGTSPVTTTQTGFCPWKTYRAVDNHRVPVVVGRWFRLETFSHRSTGADGEFWAKIDGETVVDHWGANVGMSNAPINRIMLRLSPADPSAQDCHDPRRGVSAASGTAA
jgi:hypothetical protein